LFTAVARDGLDGHAADRGEEIPDPYYGDIEDFERVYEMVREAAEALADKLQ
jgi:protein-tyrosine phosphatase